MLARFWHHSGHSSLCHVKPERPRRLLHGFATLSEFDVSRLTARHSSVSLSIVWYGTGSSAELGTLPALCESLKILCIRCAEEVPKQCRSSAEAVPKQCRRGGGISGKIDKKYKTSKDALYLSCGK
jgi:hypothetical protein